MMQTFSIYFFLPLFAVIFTQEKFLKIKIKDEVPVLSIGFFSGLILILIALIFGMRQIEFSVDFVKYVEHYINFDYYSRIRPHELGYDSLVKFFSGRGVHFSVFFILIEFTTLYLVVKSLNQRYYILPFLMFFMFTDGFIFDTTNLVRHTVAFGFFSYSIKYIEKKNIIKYLACIFLASLFHKSVLITIPLYFIIDFDWFKYRLQFTFLTGIFLFLHFVGGFRYIILFGLKIFKYSAYLNDLDNTLANTAMINTGLGVLVFTGIDIFMVYFFSTVLKKKYQSFKIYYNLHLFGLLVFFVTSGISVLGRANYYFINFRLFTMSIFLHYLFKSRNKLFYIIGVFIILMYSIGYFMRITTPSLNYVPFLFYFQ